MRAQSRVDLKNAARVSAICVLISIAGASVARSEDATKPGPRPPVDVIVESHVDDGSSLTVKCTSQVDAQGKPVTCLEKTGQDALGPIPLTVSDTALQKSVKALSKGDWIKISYSYPDKGADEQISLTAFSTDVIDTQYGQFGKFFTILISAAICCLLYYFLSGLDPKGLILGQDNRYSNSKFQTVLWFGILVTAYLSVSWIRLTCDAHFVGNINIPTNLLLLSGMSAFTYAAAKGITTSKVNAAAAAGNNNAKPPATNPNLLLDLTHNDGQPAAVDQPARQPMLDLGDTQMVVVTLLAVAVYLVVLWNFLDSIPKTTFVKLPDVDTTILASFGLGQGAYLAKKAAGTPGQS